MQRVLAETYFIKPLTLTLSPQAGRGDDGNCRLSLLPVYGENVPDRADEGPPNTRTVLPRDSHP